MGSGGSCILEFRQAMELRSSRDIARSHPQSHGPLRHLEKKIINWALIRRQICKGNLFGRKE